MTDAISERDRRLSLWHSLSNERLDDVEPQRLRDLGIYGGAQGIWVDKAHTASPGCPDFCWKREGRHCRETILRGLYLRFNRSRWSIFVGVSDKCSLEDG